MHICLGRCEMIYGPRRSCYLRASSSESAWFPLLCFRITCFVIRLFVRKQSLREDKVEQKGPSAISSQVFCEMKLDVQDDLFGSAVSRLFFVHVAVSIISVPRRSVPKQSEHASTSTWVSALFVVYLYVGRRSVQSAMTFYLPFLYLTSR